jgi:hypothetical protein
MSRDIRYHQFDGAPVFREEAGALVFAQRLFPCPFAGDWKMGRSKKNNGLRLQCSHCQSVYMRISPGKERAGLNRDFFYFEVAYSLPRHPFDSLSAAELLSVGVAFFSHCYYY